MSETPQDKATRYIRPKDVDNRASRSQRVLWAIEAFFWDWIYWKPMKAMKIDKASNLGAKIFRLLGPLAGSSHRTATRNLQLAFPHWTEQQIKACALATWENFGRIAGELPHLAEMREDGPDPRIVVTGDEHLRPFLTAGKPVVYISGHLANWEVMITTVIHRAPDSEITYRSVNNPHIDRCIAENRLSTGVRKLAAKGIGTRDLMRALSTGRSIALMNDQKFNQGIPVPLFGYNAMTAPGPTRLALKYGAPIFLFACRRTGPGRYAVDIHPPHWPDTELPLDEAVEKSVRFINAWMEDRIREAPEQWFWQHNRWPKTAWKEAGVT
ncbi:MAG: lysophospholipid acyltransferase family protein [Hyphomonadaceae bacterium]